ncbi:MAG: anti-sigma factor [bacterium]
MDNQRLIKQLLIWGGLLVLLLAILWGYKRDWWRQDFGSVNQKQIELSRQEIDDKLADITYWGYQIYLADVSGQPNGEAGGEGKGKAAYRFMNDQYEHLVVAELPEPPAGYFYESWLIRAELKSQVSMGKMFKQSDGRYTTLFKDARNYSDFNQVSVALEPNDGNPEPARLDESSARQAQIILTGSYK